MENEIKTKKELQDLIKVWDTIESINVVFKEKKMDRKEKEHQIKKREKAIKELVDFKIDETLPEITKAHLKKAKEEMELEKRLLFNEIIELNK